MEKKKWLWKRKSSERSPGETESLGSFSSHSERYSDEQSYQDASRGSPNDSTQSPEVMSKASITDHEPKESVKNLTEKLSAALVNVSAKEELVKQHAKVAEEAVAGWEKAENEVAALRQQNMNLEVRVSNLDGALKECVRQLRQRRDEQEKRISDAVVEKSKKWESEKVELEKQILELHADAEAARTENAASVDPKSLLILETLDKENSFLKQKLEILTVERDLSTKAAEAASKLQLESIKKVAKLEAECRRLQSVIARKSPPVHNQKSYFYAESITDSHSSNVETCGSEPSCSDSWASALLAELDQFRNEKLLPNNNLAAFSSEIDMMDDFLEMEHLAALPETKSNTPFTVSESACGEYASMDNPLRANLDSMIQRVAELEKKLEKMEAEKVELETALDESRSSLKAAQIKMAEAETKVKKLQKELIAVNEAKELLEFQLIGIEETEIQQNSNSNGELKLKQEDLAVGADKLVECQKTIASLGRQLKSLATLEDFLVDASNIPGFSSRDSLVSGSGDEIRKLHSKDALSDLDPPRISTDKDNHRENGNGEDSPPPSSLLSSLANNVPAAKSRNGFGKFFSRSKSVIELDNRQE